MKKVKTTALILITVIITYKSHTRLVQFKSFLFESAESSFQKDKNPKPLLKERLDIYVENESLQKLNQCVNEALRRKNIGKNQKKELNAVVKFDGENHKAKIRLKGDNIDHVDTDKWSLNIRYNHKSFNIQHPKTRSYIYEWILHKAFDEANILSTSYDFIQVFINKQNKGIYAKEESIDNSFLIKRNLELGPILKFSENKTWQEYRIKGFTNTSGFLNSRIKMSNPEFKTNLNTTKEAFEKLNLFRSKQTDSLNEIFDLNIWARYFAVIEVFGGIHGSNWHNLRFYFNPSTSKFEPIGYDGSELNKKSIIQLTYGDLGRDFSNEIFSRLFFDDENFTKLFIKELNLFLKDDFVGKVFNKNRSEQAKLNKYLALEFQTDTLIENNLRDRINYLKKVYDPYMPIFATTKDSFDLWVGNSFYIPIELIELKSKTTSTNLKRKIVKHKSLKTPLKLIEVPIRNLNLLENKYKLTYRILGQDSVRETKIKYYYK